MIESVNPRQNFDVNVGGTLNCLEAAKVNSCKKFIFASTGGALMGNAPPPVSENSVPSPLSPYGASKLAGEAYCQAYSKSYGLHTLIFRFANVFGKYSLHKQGVFNKFFECITSGRPLQIYGTPTRDFIYADDLVTGIIEGTERAPKRRHFSPELGTETKILDFAKLLFKEYGSEHSFEFQTQSQRAAKSCKFSITCNKRYIWFQV